MYLKVIGPFWQDISQRLMKLVEVGRSAFDLAALGKLQEVTAQVERHHTAVQWTITELEPWIPLLADPPPLLREPQFSQIIAALQANLPANLAPGQVQAHVRAAWPNVNTLRDRLAEVNSPAAAAAEQGSTQQQTVLHWLDELEQALEHADANAAALVARFAQIVLRTEQYVNEMDFRFLYHLRRRVFHIGFNLDAGLLDHNYYDLLASEARIASIIAIAKGDVPQRHWMQLSRPVTRSRRFVRLALLERDDV